MKNICFGLLVVFCLGALLYACKKNTLTTAPYDYVEGTALFKVNYASPYSRNPAVRIKVNGNIVSNGITYATPFPGGGLNTGGSSNADYLSISPGSDSVSLVISKAGSDVDSIVLYKTTINVESSKYYTLHIADTAENTQSVLATDVSNKPDSGYSTYTFINLIPNSTVDFYFGTTKLASNIAYKQKTDTFNIVAGSVAQFFIKTAGTATNLNFYPVTTGTTYTIPNQRAFTAYARGYLTYAGSTTDIRRPQLSFVYNK